jgi:hypothetical protein
MDIERRRHPRRDTLTAIMVAPNGNEHSAAVMDVSAGGARIWLPEDDWTPFTGAALRLSFEIDPAQTFVVQGQVVRVCVDHLGVQFAPDQELQIAELLVSLN